MIDSARNNAAHILLETLIFLCVHRNFSSDNDIAKAFRAVLGENFSDSVEASLNEDDEHLAYGYV